MNKPLNIKLVALALLALILAFAVKQVEWKVMERQATRDGAVRAIADQYAREQQLSGPLLWVKCSEPATLIETDAKGVTQQRDVIQDCSRAIRPNLLSSQGNLDVSERYRGIYKARVYHAGLNLHAELPAFQAKPGQLIEEAHLIFGVGDPRGLKRIKLTSSDGQTMNAKPGVPGGAFEQGFHVPLEPAQLAQGLKLDAELEIAGRTLLGSWPAAASLGAGYGLLYFGLYQLLASEDYALLMGAWLIFGLLGLTMYLTRRLDWGRAGQTNGQGE